MSLESATAWLTLAGVGLPAALFVLLGAPLAVGLRLPERWIGGLTAMFSALSALAFAAALAGATARTGSLVIPLTQWFAAGGTAFHVDLLADRMSLAFALLTSVIGGTVAGFSHRYLHREHGYHRYFLLYAMFLTGMLLVALAGSVEVLFTGWELLGLSSALLVGFFHERAAPVRNALAVFVVYRASDAAMLAATVLVHHLHGGSSLALLFGRTPASGALAISSAEATAIGFLLALAAAGKCAQLPFSWWLPRAMEGPTPSSAVYYGALSVHAGAYLLLRAGPILERSPLLCAMIGLMGAATAVYAAFVRRVQTDVKSSLAFASLTHVSLVLVEIALGWYRLAFVHLLGNACLRLLQFLRAPSVLHDFHEARSTLGEQAIGARGTRAGEHARLRLWLYRFALERGYLEPIVERALVEPFVRATRAVDAAERWWADRIGGPPRVGHG